MRWSRRRAAACWIRARASRRHCASMSIPGSKRRARVAEAAGPRDLAAVLRYRELARACEQARTADDFVVPAAADRADRPPGRRRTGAPPGVGAKKRPLQAAAFRNNYAVGLEQVTDTQRELLLVDALRRGGAGGTLSGSRCRPTQPCRSRCTCWYDARTGRCSRCPRPSNPARTSTHPCVTPLMLSASEYWYEARIEPPNSGTDTPSIQALLSYGAASAERVEDTRVVERPERGGCCPGSRRPRAV